MFQSKNIKDLLLASCIEAGILTEDQLIQIAFGWPSLLEYLNLELLFENFPKFDQQDEILHFIIATLSLQPEKERLIHLYDQLFANCLTHVKALPEIQPKFLLNQIQKKRQTDTQVAQLLDLYERSFVEHLSSTMHDLILYLAWDRVCMNLAIVFEHIDYNTNIINSLKILKECLIESFQHITSQGRTSPSFFRLIETLYAYQMRDENLQTHTEAEWLILCQSARALKSRNLLSDIFYIDAAILEKEKLNKLEQKKEIIRVFTLDSPEIVRATLSLAHYMIEKLSHEIPNWQYSLCPIEIICITESENHFKFNTTIRSE